MELTARNSAAAGRQETFPVFSEHLFTYLCEDGFPWLPTHVEFMADHNSKLISSSATQRNTFCLLIPESQCSRPSWSQVFPVEATVAKDAKLYNRILVSRKHSKVRK